MLNPKLTALYGLVKRAEIELQDACFTAADMEVGTALACLDSARRAIEAAEALLKQLKNADN